MVSNALLRFISIAPAYPFLSNDSLHFSKSNTSACCALFGSGIYGDRYLYKFFLPCEAYLTFEGELQKVNGTAYEDADVITLTNNGLMYLFSNVKYTLSGQELESLNSPRQCTSMLGMLTYPDNFSKSSGLINYDIRTLMQDFQVTYLNLIIQKGRFHFRFI